MALDSLRDSHRLPSGLRARAKKSRFAPIAVALLAALACTTARDEHAAISDTLVLNPRPTAQTPQWRLSAQPTLVIGHEGDSLYEFHRPGTPITLSDGRIVVPNAQRELRYYDANGRHLLTAGRSGQGPGDFQLLLHAWRLPGDTVAASDGEGPPRLAIYGPEGRFVRSMRTEFTGYTSVRLDDGQWIANTGVGHGLGERHPRPACAPVPTQVRNTYPVGRFDADGDKVRQLAIIHGNLALAIGCSQVTVPFGPEGSYVVGGRWLYTTAAEEHVIERRSVIDGQVRQVIRTEAEVRPVTEAMIADHLGERNALRSRFGMRTEGGMSAFDAAMKYPKVLPAIASMKVDAAGNLWVRRYYVTADAEHEWWIYAPTGVLMARMFSPANFRIGEIGTDYVLGRWRDELDVESVRRFALLK